MRVPNITCWIIGHVESDLEIEWDLEANNVTWFCERCGRRLFTKEWRDAPAWVQADLLEIRDSASE